MVLGLLNILAHFVHITIFAGAYMLADLAIQIGARWWVEVHVRFDFRFILDRYRRFAGLWRYYSQGADPHHGLYPGGDGLDFDRLLRLANFPVYGALLAAGSPAQQSAAMAKIPPSRLRKCAKAMSLRWQEFTQTGGGDGK
jgi:hypothetical protein